MEMDMSEKIDMALINMQKNEKDYAEIMVDVIK